MSFRRLALVAVMWFGIVGPTPGAVGDCNGSKLDQPADVGGYCRQREELTCVRRFLRGEISASARDACRWDAIDTCAARSFAASCRPKAWQTRACLNALASFDTLQTKESDLSECNTRALCAGEITSTSRARDAGRSDASENDAGTNDAGASTP